MTQPNRWIGAISALARLAALALVPAVLGYAGQWHWLLDLCAHFRWQYLIALSAGLVAAVGLRRRGMALVLATGWLLNSWSLLTATGPSPTLLPAASASPPMTLTLLVVNIHVGLTDVAPLLRLIDRESPDVIGIIELSPGVAQRLAVLDRRYPAHQTAPRDDPFGIGAWSRRPMAGIDIVDSPPLGHPTLQLRFADAGIGQLWMTHPFPPIGAQATRWRDEQLDFVAAQVGRDPAALVAGDFNATPWSASYREFRRRTQLLDSAAGYWPWPTWFGENLAGRILAVPIDHLFHGSGWRVIERRIGADIGSDHRPLIVRLARVR